MQSACVAACCNVLQCAAVCCSVLQCVAVRCSVLQCVAVCCSVLQCGATHVLQHVAMCSLSRLHDGLDFDSSTVSITES